MLTIEPPFYQIRGVTIFRDHEDDDRFYCLLGQPRLLAREDGSPSFTLYKYRRDLTDNPELDPTRAKGAGIALFEVELPLERRVLIESELAALSGRSEVELTPVLFRSGEVRAILAREEEGGLIEDLVHSRRAPLNAPHRAAFALALSAEGSTFFEQAARGGLLPVGVAYEMRFLALAPGVQARVRMDYERIYDRFAASVGFSYYVSAKLDLDLQWLIENDVIQIEIIAFTDEEDRQRQEALVMNLVKARIQGDFFRSGIPPTPQAGVGGVLGELLGGLVGGEVTSATALFVLKAKYEAVEERKAFELTFDSRTAVELTHVVTGLLSSMFVDEDDDPIEPDVREIDLDDPFFSALEVRVSSVIDFDQMRDLREAHAELSLDDHRGHFPFEREAAAHEGDRVFRHPITAPAKDQYSYRVQYHFDPDEGDGPTRIDAGPFSSRRRVLVVDPLEHVRYRRLRLLLGPIDSALVPRMHVHLRVPGDEGEDDLTRRTVLLTEQNPEVVWRQRLPIDAPPIRVFARPDWEDPSGEVHRGIEREVVGDSFVALGPYREVLKISLQPVVDWTSVIQLLVELRYRDGGYQADRRILFTPEEAGSRLLEIPLLDGARRSYEWRQIVFDSDGTAVETAWEKGDQTVLLVGRQPLPRDVQLVWVGDAGEALFMRVDFWIATAGGDEEQLSTLLEPGQSIHVTLPLDPDGLLRYRYEISRVTALGQERVRGGAGESNLLVVHAAG